MNLIWTITKVALPLLIMIAVGFLIRKSGIMNDASVEQTNRAVYLVFLPLLVFQKTRNATLDVDLNSRFVFTVLTIIVFQFLLSLCIVLLSEKNNAKRGVMLQGMFHSNHLLFALSISTELFSMETASLATILGTVVVPIYLFLSVVGLALFDGGHPGFFKTVTGVLLNPVVIASVLGILCVVFEISLPNFVERAIDHLAGIAIPLSFVLLGASLGFREMRSSAGGLSLTLLMKLLVFPAVLLGVAILLGYRGSELAVLLVLSASPVAVSTFTMAGEMGGDDTLASQIVCFSTVLSVLTFSLFYFLLGYFGYFS